VEHTGSLHKDPRKTIRETVVQEPRAVAGFCAKICCQEFVVRTTICQRTHGTIKSAKSCQVCHKDTSKEPSSKKHNIRHKRADEKVTEVLPLSRTPRFWKRQWRTGKTNICIRTNSCPQLYSTRGAKPVPFVLVFALEPHRWQGRTLSGIRDERNSHCFTTDCIGFNWFRCAGQHFRLKVYLKKKEQRNSPSTFKSIVSLFHPHVAVGSRFIMVCPNLGRQASPSPFLEGSLGVSLQVVVPFCAFMYVLFVSQFVW
jgi:hypothetical protein